MRIILTSNFSPWSAYSGGGQRSTHQLACALAQRGHTVTVVFTKPPWEAVRAPADLPYALRWAALPALRSSSAALLRPLAALGVARHVAHELGSSERAIVHSTGDEAALIPRLRERRRFGFVVTPRFPGLPAYLGREPTLSDRARWLFRDTRYALLGAALRDADLCAPPSRWAAELYRASYGLAPERMTAVHNGVPSEFLAYAWSPPRDPAAPILFFGRFDHDKGLDTLLEAHAELGKAAPPLLFAGRGPLGPALGRWLRERHERGRSHVLPWQSHDSLAALIVRSRAVVLPSRRENLSLAVLSALAVGAPLVTTAVGGTPELIDDGVHARLFPAGDAAALARALSELLADPEAAAETGARGRARVRSEFTWQHAAQHFERHYERLLGGRALSEAA